MDQARAIERLLQAWHRSGQFHGAALVAAGDAVIYQGGFGHASLEWRIPHTPDTRFKLGSITKQFTAALALQLAEAGRLRLDAPAWLRLPCTPAQYLRRFLPRRLAFAPGTGVRYSTPGYYLAGLALEAAAGRPFADLLREWILAPAGMADSGLFDGRSLVERCAQGYERGPGGLSPAPYRDPSTTFAASGMYATVQDLHRWDRMLFAGSFMIWESGAW